jgi:hypothetical protein
MSRQADAGSGLPFNKVSNIQRDDLNGGRLLRFSTREPWILQSKPRGYCEAPQKLEARRLQ